MRVTCKDKSGPEGARGQPEAAGDAKEPTENSGGAGFGGGEEVTGAEAEQLVAPGQRERTVTASAGWAERSRRMAGRATLRLPRVQKTRAEERGRQGGP